MRSRGPGLPVTRRRAATACGPRWRLAPRHAGPRSVPASCGPTAVLGLDGAPTGGEDHGAGRPGIGRPGASRMPGNPYIRPMRNPPRFAKKGPDRGLSGKREGVISRVWRNLPPTRSAYPVRRAWPTAAGRRPMLPTRSRAATASGSRCIRRPEPGSSRASPGRSLGPSDTTPGKSPASGPGVAPFSSFGWYPSWLRTAPVDAAGSDAQPGRRSRHRRRHRRASTLSASDGLAERRGA